MVALRGAASIMTAAILAMICLNAATVVIVMAGNAAFIVGHAIAATIAIMKNSDLVLHTVTI